MGEVKNQVNQASVLYYSEPITNVTLLPMKKVLFIHALLICFCGQAQKTTHDSVSPSPPCVPTETYPHKAEILNQLNVVSTWSAKKQQWFYENFTLLGNVVIP